MLDLSDKRVTIGILAHVDAGKTTLCEALLYAGNVIRTPGRVDRSSTLFDSDPMERKRGITITSKTAELKKEHSVLTILDTPGHADLCAETEQTLHILDYALLVISGTDGVQANTRMLLRRLDDARIPCFIFVTKMDVSSSSRAELLEELSSALSRPCLDFTEGFDAEAAALCDESLLEEFLENGGISDSSMARAIQNRMLVPCYFGSGLKGDGTESLLSGLHTYTLSPVFSDLPSAMVYRISRDDAGKRLTFVRITGGSYHVRDEINGEKITEIRLYTGNRYETVPEVSAGQVCALLGLTGTFPGQGLGAQIHSPIVCQPSVLRSSVRLNPKTDVTAVLPKFLEFGDEHPELSVRWDSRARAITMNLRGCVQEEYIRSLFADRYGLAIDFDPGQVIFLETVSGSGYGIGHYEPLKHYAEVHLKVEPLPEGSGVEVSSALSHDDLDENYVNQIMSILQSEKLTGVLTGSPLTDVRITLLAGRGHLKHTEGGDFRQATLRAVHNALMQAASVLLEPLYRFELQLPNSCAGRALSDLHQFHADIERTEPGHAATRISGTVRVRKLGNYPREVLSYTSGEGQLLLSAGGWSVCEDAQEIIDGIGYQVRSDEVNTPDSVFCSHGAGICVPWDEVAQHCHIPPVRDRSAPAEPVEQRRGPANGCYDEEQLEEIMLREFGPIRRKSYREAVVHAPVNKSPAARPILYIVDGYNVIHAWESLQPLSAEQLDLARGTLENALASFAAYSGNEVLLVYDAYRSAGKREACDNSGALHIRYSASGQSADAYIEQLISEIGQNYSVHVISSDFMIQQSAVRSGVLRFSSREFEVLVKDVLERMRTTLETPPFPNN